jgi:glycosyltransferase involved in cell wall biosynthesis
MTSIRLLVVSHTPHYYQGGRIVGWGATVRELDYLAHSFHEVVHVAPLHYEKPPASSLSYNSKNVRFVAIPSAGGDDILSKVNLLRMLPYYARTVWHELSSTDIVHVRCPSNIGLITLVLLSIARRPRFRWVKYAGNWSPDNGDALSYKLQRWWLNKQLHRGIVTVNGRWPDQKPHVHSFLNPCLTEQEIADASELVKEKRLSYPIRLLYVGLLATTKGVGQVLNIVSYLHRGGLQITLDLVGDGPERPHFERITKTLNISQLVKFHGWVPRPSLAPIYAQSHIILLPSISEGWPKVLSEAMAYGVVSIAGAVSSIPQILGDTGTGVAFPPEDVDAFAKAIIDFAKEPQKWQSASSAGIAAATRFTYENYVCELSDMFQDAWGFPLS